jgi:hypothetical protein
MSMIVPEWRSSPWDGILRTILDRWNCTKYKAGEVDCWSWIANVLLEAYGRPHMALPRAYFATFGEERAKCRERFLEVFPNGYLLPLPYTLAESGDIVVQETEKIIHLRLVGVRRGELWHVSKEDGVCQGGWVSRISAVYRLRDKHVWIR